MVPVGLSILLMRRRTYRLLLASALFALTGCASMPASLNVRPVDATLAPLAVARQPTAFVGREVRWGGIIIAISNRPHSTRIEILAYPLDRIGHPEADGMPLGRFFAEVPGYLEPMIYRRGRAVTVVGRVRGVLHGHIGLAPYLFPDVAERALHLWPRQRPAGSHFGVGIGIGIGT